MPHGIIQDPEAPYPLARVKPYPFFARPLKPPADNLSSGDVVRQLKDAVLGPAEGSGKAKRALVLGRHDDEFELSSKIFNGAVKSPALALVKPTNAMDVSRTIVFCRDHGIELSVKGGGTGVHGWSVAGHVILDLSLMDDISIALPDPYPHSLQQSFETLLIGLDSISPDTELPSLGDLRAGSSESGVKRTAADARFSETDGSVPKGKRKVESVGEEGQGDLGSVPAPRRESGPDSGRGAGSGSRGGSNSMSGSQDFLQSASTAFASLPGSIPYAECAKPPDSLASTSRPGISLSQFAPNTEAGLSYQPPPPRITYVNPSQTPASSFPFLPPTVGARPPAMSPVMPYQSTCLNAVSPEHRQLTLNINPNPPPYLLVTFGAGVHSKQLDSATAASPYGAFHVPTSAFPVGLGQFISGGFGFLGRKHGMAMDNLVEVEMVLADGRIVWVGENGVKGGEWKEGENPEEVWWAVRGAGAVLGVVTRLRAKAYYVPSVYAGIIIYLFDHQTTPGLLRHVRDCMKGAQRTVYLNFILTAGPPGAPAIVVLQMCFSGPNGRAEGETYIQAISSYDGARSMFQDFSERAFDRQQLAVEDVLKGGYGRKWYIQSDMLTSLTDEVVDETCARFHSVPDGCTWLFEYSGNGETSDIKDSCYPMSHRECAFTVVALHQWSHDEPPLEDTLCVTTAEDWFREVIHPNSPGGPLPCFLQRAGENDVIGVYGQDNYERLKRLKALLDPTNLFRHAMWPSPGE